MKTTLTLTNARTGRTARIRVANGETLPADKVRRIRRELGTDDGPIGVLGQTSVTPKSIIVPELAGERGQTRTGRVEVYFGTALVRKLEAEGRA